jgi:hypothetical protein
MSSQCADIAIAGEITVAQMASILLAFAPVIEWHSQM